MNTSSPIELVRGVVQCLIAALAVLAVMLLARRRAPGLLKEISFAELRGLLQIFAVGAILAALLRGPAWTSIFVLAGMILAAASIVRKRAKQIPACIRAGADCHWHRRRGDSDRDDGDGSDPAEDSHAAFR